MNRNEESLGFQCLACALAASLAFPMDFTHEIPPHIQYVQWNDVPKAYNPSARRSRLDAVDTVFATFYLKQHLEASCCVNSAKIPPDHEVRTRN